MRFFLWFALGLCIGTPAIAAKLNVLFILVDDWGWADAGVQGMKAPRWYYQDTPWLDPKRGGTMNKSYCIPTA